MVLGNCRRSCWPAPLPAMHVRAQGRACQPAPRAPLPSRRPSRQTAPGNVRFRSSWAEDGMVDFHLRSLGAQLGQLRTALALALALNRTLVMPKVCRQAGAAGWARWLHCVSKHGRWQPAHVAPPPLLTHAHLPALPSSSTQLIAWCDRYWGPVEHCQLPGAFKMRLPFVAPMDHVLGGCPGEGSGAGAAPRQRPSPTPPTHALGPRCRRRALPVR